MRVIPWNGEKISAPGIYSGVSSAKYHSADLCVGPSISSSGLRKIFTESPLDFWITSYYNPLRLEEEPSRALIVGRAAHHLLLGEADFGKFFVVRPATYPDTKTGEMKKWTTAAHFCKAWEAARKDENLEILTPDELETIKGMAGIQPWQKGLDDSGLLNNAVVRAGALHGLVEHAIIARDAETGVWIKSKPDVIPVDSREASDLKTAQSIEPRKLQMALDDYRLDMQGEMVSRCLEQAEGFRLESFALIFACKSEPHEVAVRELKPCDLDTSAEDNQAAIRTFALCMERGKWPGRGGGEEDARYLERSDRSRERATLRREQLKRMIFG